MITSAQVEPPPVRGALVARNALLNLAGLGTPLVVAFVTLPVLIGGLGTERFGVLAIAWMLLTYLSELGFGSTTTRYAAEAIGAGQSSRLAGIAWTTAGLQVAVGLLEGGVLAALTPWLVGSVLSISPELTGEARGCLYLLALAIPLVGAGRAFRGLVEAAQRFDLALAVHLPITAATYLLAALAASAGWSLPAVFAIILLSRIATLPGYLVAARRALPGVSLRPAVHREGLRELSAFAGWVGVSSVVSPLLVYLDRFMVGVLLSMTAVTFYAAPYEVVGRLALVPAGIVGALYPAFSQLNGRSEARHAERLAARSLNLVLVVLAPVLILVLTGAYDGLALWLGPEYAERSALALQILVLGVLVNAAAHVPYGLLQSIGRPDIPARFHLIELPVQVVAAWLLVSRFGIPGAAMAWSGRMLLDAILLFTAGARTGALRTSALRAERLATTLGIVLSAAAAATLAGSVIPAGTARVLTAAALAATTAGVLWLRAVPAVERRRIRALFQAGA